MLWLIYCKNIKVLFLVYMFPWKAKHCSNQIPLFYLFLISQFGELMVKKRKKKKKKKKKNLCFSLILSFCSYPHINYFRCNFCVLMSNVMNCHRNKNVPAIFKNRIYFSSYFQSFVFCLSNVFSFLKRFPTQ